MSEQDWEPATWLEFNEEGKTDTGAAKRLTTLLDANGVEDLVVMAHGWKNDKKDAEQLYGTLWAHTCSNFPDTRVAKRMIVAGVLWPAKVFRTDFDAASLATTTTTRTLAVSGGAKEHDLSEGEFSSLLADFETFIGTDAETIAAARTAGKALTEGASHALVSKAARAIGISAKSPGPDTELARDAAPIVQAQVSATNAQLLLSALSGPPELTLAPRLGTVMGLGSAVEGLIAGPKAAVGRLLNQLTYYEMKKRAGIAGAGLANVLAKLTPKKPIRLHMVGHSFGGRLVTATANQLQSTNNLELFSLTILQGAYSHNALARQVKPGVDGAFSSVVGKPTGPITITHTHNDLACTVAYALASRLSRDTTQGIGDASDEFGAMGANGPQKLAQDAAEPDDTTQAFAPKRRKVNTFLADEFIVKTTKVDAHNNITNETVGRLLAKTILA